MPSNERIVPIMPLRLEEEPPLITNEEMQEAMSATDKEPFVVAKLLASADIYRERNKIYGNNYKRFGPILSLILAGQKLDTANEHQMSRLGIFVQVVAKMTRYGNQFTAGGHMDSLDDITVYAQMLAELDSEK